MASDPAHATVRGALPAGLAVVGSVLMIASGVSPGQAIALTAVVAVQGATGAVWWSLVRRPTPVAATEALGMGLALGTLGALLFSQLLRTTPIGGVAWAVPSLAAAVAWLLTRRSGLGIRPTTRAELGGLTLAGALGVLALVPFWRSNPLRWTGWWHVNQDLVYHESLARSLHSFGPNDSTLLAGHPTPYHWFAHAWSGSVAAAVEADSFVTMTRVVPLVALVAVVAVAMAWARHLSEVPWVPAVAAVLVAASGFVGTSAGRGALLPPLSPSLSFSLPWLLGASLVVTEHLARRLDRRALAPLALLAAGCVGGKVTNGAILAGALGFVALASLRWDAPARRRLVPVVLVSALGVVASYLLVVAGANQSLAVGFDDTTSDALGLEPVAGPIGIALGSLSLVLAIAARWVGLGSLLTDPRWRREPVVAYSLGAAAAGVLGTVLLTHPGNSQIFFVLSASAVVSVPAAVGLGALAERHVEIGAPTTRWVVVAGLAAAAVGSALHLAGEGGPVGWAAPVAVWLLVAAGVLVATRADRGAARRPRLLALAAIGLAAASVGAIGAGAVQDLVRHEGPSRPHEQLAWTEAHREAATWLVEAADSSDIVATNRFCTVPAEEPTDCSSRWFLTSALTGLRMHIEGYDYGVGVDDLPSWAKRRVDRSVGIADHPDAETAQALWDEGVRWVWIDPTLTTTRAWEPYASVAFSNDVVTILRLNPA